MSSSPPNGASLKTQRRSSYDVLKGIAPESNLPLPRRDGGALEDFREGIPMNFNGGSPASPPGYKRGTSPTRTLSRTYLAFCFRANAMFIRPAIGIPVSSVGRCSRACLVCAIFN
jgi:hypothetical protein